MSSTELVTVDDDSDTVQSLAVGLTRAEIDQQIATARTYPRDVPAVRKRIYEMVTLDEETAEECTYALPRGGKPIKGPSIRFAEILKASYGNCRAAARVVHVDRIEKVVEAEGVFHDLETNSATSARVRRRIVDKYGKIFSDDMIIVTGNAACSIALRNAILGGVPKPFWRMAYDAAQSVISGDVATFTERRDKAFKSLAAFGVTPEEVAKALGLASVDAMTLDHLPTLRGMYSALKNGEETVETMFRSAPQSDPKAPSQMIDKLDAAQSASSTKNTAGAEQDADGQAGGDGASPVNSPSAEPTPPPEAPAMPETSEVIPEAPPSDKTDQPAVEAAAPTEQVSAAPSPAAEPAGGGEVTASEETPPADHVPFPGDEDDLEEINKHRQKFIDYAAKALNLTHLNEAHKRTIQRLKKYPEDLRADAVASVNSVHEEAKDRLK